MKHVLFAAAVAVLAAPAMAQAPGAQVFDAAAHQRNYSTEAPGRQFQCFNGKTLTGVNRVGDRTVYVQSKAGEVFNLQLAKPCDALAAAEKITVRVAGGDVVCAQSGAQLVVQTAAGAKRCNVSNVSILTKRELASLTPSQPR